MSTNFEDLILRDITGNRPAFGIPGRLFYDTTLEKWERDTGAAWEDCEPAAGGGGDMTWASILASQLVNEIKGWPPIVNTGDLDALNLWWDKQGTPTTAPTVTDTSVAGLTDDYELCLKVVTDAASEGLYQRFTYADEPRVKAGRVVSALVAIWSVSSVSVTAKLVNSDASHTDASAVTAAAWTIVEIPAHTLAGTYCDLQITAGAAGTFYVVPLGMNIGARGVPLPPRPTRYVDAQAEVLSNVDPGGSPAGWIDVDLTSSTSPLTFRAQLHGQYKNTSTAGVVIRVRCNGSGSSSYANILVGAMTTAAQYWQGTLTVFTDDGQGIEYDSGGLAADAESFYLYVVSYWEWA